ncbi:uncharacterized protein EV420DRAFT_1270672 [Desarmillaria tabescens]|uniref:Uncharacterized protein n=1 Tax=Armillaria tabescens TaxID=1929756 RepID=A0AA39N577_ARMTA|nr:uncharacterized protein EV420DRAFT_1270672 [Desarmillaria tabescens]KAK0458357.1 hypothetical protein EV420DRAFT_1270672 [Desarmillaria tabescens]
MKLAFSTALFTALFTAASATPATKRDIYTPPVLSPTTGKTWLVETTQTVSWDTSNPPDLISNRNESRIVLTKGGFFLPYILADRFDILLGSIEVKVPLVAEGDDYAVVLFGDSGNFGKQFSIKGGPAN